MPYNFVEIPQSVTAATKNMATVLSEKMKGKCHIFQEENKQPTSVN